MATGARRGGLRRRAGDLLADGGLESAVMLSLFTGRRVDGQRGWWGDTVAVVPGDEFGSRLWTLSREVDRPTVLRACAEEYASEALAWLVEDQVAERVDVIAESASARRARVSWRCRCPCSDRNTTTSYRYVQLGRVDVSGCDNSFQPTDVAAARGTAQADFVSQLDLAGAVLRRGVVAVFARVQAGVAHMLHGHLAYLGRQLFPDLADAEFLLRHADLYGYSQGDARFAYGLATVTGGAGVTVPAGVWFGAQTG